MFKLAEIIYNILFEIHSELKELIDYFNALFY